MSQFGCTTVSTSFCSCLSLLTFELISSHTLYCFKHNDLWLFQDKHNTAFFPSFHLLSSPRAYCELFLGLLLVNWSSICSVACVKQASQRNYTDYSGTSAKASPNRFDSMWQTLCEFISTNIIHLHHSRPGFALALLFLFFITLYQFRLFWHSCFYQPCVIIAIIIFLSEIFVYLNDI